MAVGTDPERELFPGIFAVALAALGLWTARGDERLSRWARLYGVIVVVGAVLSFGPIVRVWGLVITTHGPYGWLLRAVPGMDGMRVPARFAIVVVAGLSVLVGCGVFAWLVGRVKRPARPVAIALCLAAIVADGWAVPIPIVRYSARGRAEDRAVASWLADRSPGALLHLPSRNRETIRRPLSVHGTLRAIGHPTSTATAGHATPPLAFSGSRARQPIHDLDRLPAAWRFRSIGVRYVIVHPGDYDAASRAIYRTGRLVRAFRLGADRGEARAR